MIELTIVGLQQEYYDGPLNSDIVYALWNLFFENMYKKSPQK